MHAQEEWQPLQRFFSLESIILNTQAHCILQRLMVSAEARMPAIQFISGVVRGKDGPRAEGRFGAPPSVNLAPSTRFF